MLTVCTHGYVKALATLLREHPELLNEPLGQVHPADFLGESTLRVCCRSIPARDAAATPPHTRRLRDLLQFNEVPLLVAVRRGQEEAVQLLMSYNPNSAVLSHVSFQHLPLILCTVPPLSTLCHRMG